MLWRLYENKNILQAVIGNYLLHESKLQSIVNELEASN